MSSILKALKKLEHEKTGRFPESLNINADILRSTESTRNFSPFTILLFSLLIFGGGAAATFLFLNNSRLPQPATKSQQIVSAEDDQPQVQVSDRPDTLPAEIIVVPAKSRSVERRHTVQYKAADTASSAANIPHTVVEPIKMVKTKEVATAVKSEYVAIARTVPVLRVNGIAFQNRGTDSLAIVNGVTVTKGAVIEGVAVDDVRNDRVLFRYNGEPFEILLGQSNQ